MLTVYLGTWTLLLAFLLALALVALLSLGLFRSCPCPVCRQERLWRARRRIWRR